MGSEVATETLTRMARYDLLMKGVAIPELHVRLAEFLDADRASATVLTTEGEAVVAELEAPGPGRARSVEDAVMLEDIRRSLVTPATRRDAPKLASGSTLDGVQLATSAFVRRRLGTVQFASLDLRQRDCARAMGFEVLDL